MSIRKSDQLGGHLLFDVLYEDGTRSSNRKVATASLRDWEFDESVRAAIEAQDREIAERSGKPRGAIKSITRSGTRAADRRAKPNEAGRKRSSGR